MSSTGIPDMALRDNTNQRLPCILVIDGSASMDGDPIKHLNAGLKMFEDALKNDDIASQRVQVLIIRCGGGDEVEIISDWKDAMDFEAPVVAAHGRTPLGAGATLALAKLAEQEARYRQHGIPSNRGWLFLLTDGEPTDTDWEQAAAACKAAAAANRVTVFGIGIGDANFKKLSAFSAMSPVRLDGLNFREFFLWLSRSASTASQSELGSPLQLERPNSWGTIQT